MCKAQGRMSAAGYQQGEVMSDYTEMDKKQDIHVLHSMGYAQELERRMSSFSNFAISFSIICILSGGINSLGQATAGAGGAAIGIGWPLGCLISGILMRWTVRGQQYLQSLSLMLNS